MEGQASDRVAECDPYVLIASTQRCNADIGAQDETDDCTLG